MKLKQPRETPSRLGDFEMEDTPPIQQKSKQLRYPENENEDNANFVVQFRRRGKDNQLYHSQEFMKSQLPKSLVCNEVYDNSDFFKQSLHDERNLRSAWGLTQSQQNLLQQKKPRLDASINFRSMRPQHPLTKSKQFLQQKQIVSQVINDLIKKNQKSVEDHSRDNESIVILCSNQDGKKAKYRMQDPDQQLYYCSKCSIMLLQKGFNVTELQLATKCKPKQLPKNGIKHKEEFDELSFKIRCLKESIKNAIHGIDSSESDNRLESEQIKINDVYELIISVADAMRKRDLFSLKQNYNNIQDQRNKTRSVLNEKFTELENIESQIDNIDLNIVDQSRAKTMLNNFDKNVNIIQQEPSNYQMTIIEQSLDSRLDRLLTEVKEHWPRGAIEFSFEKSQRCDNLIKQSKQPFRHLFTDDEEVNPTAFTKSNKGTHELKFLKTRNI